MSQDSIMPGADFGKTAADYRRHRAGLPPRLFERLAAFDIGLPGQRVLDIGAGTGAMARPLAARGTSVVAGDVSPDLLRTAGVMAADAGVKLELICSGAETLPFAGASFDVVTASQCWHWFRRNEAAAECFRVLAPGGRIAIVHFDWLPLSDNVVAATEALILAHNPRWGGAGGTGVYPRWPGDVAGAGFTDIETFSFDVDVPYTHEGWRGRIRASAGVGGAMTPGEVARFDMALAALLARDFPADPLAIPHRTWALVARKPG